MQPATNDLSESILPDTPARAQSGDQIPIIDLTDALGKGCDKISKRNRRRSKADFISTI